MYIVRGAAETSKKIKVDTFKDLSAGGSARSSSDSVSIDQSVKRENYEIRASTKQPLAVTGSKNYWLGSLDTPNNAEVWHAGMSTHSGGARLLSIRRKTSLNTLQDIEVHETNSKEIEDVSENTGEKPQDTRNYENVQEHGVCLFDNLNGIDKSDSGSSMAVSDSSENFFAVSSDSESEEENELFDLDAHIERLCARENDSDTTSEGSESQGSEAAFNKAVRKVIRRIKRERSDEIAADSDSGSRASSEKSSEESDDESSEGDSDNDDKSNDSSLSGNRGLKMARDLDHEFADLMENELIIDQRNGKHPKSASSVVYRDYVTRDRIDSILETMETNPEEDEYHCVGSPMENNLASSSLDTVKVQDLRWPFSSYYIKEVQHIPKGDGVDAALPSSGSTESSPSFPGRKRNVMLGRIWWAEWWAREDTKIKSHTGLELHTVL